MNDPPDHTAELSAANLLSFCGMIVPKYCHALIRQVLLQLVVDDLGLVLGADAGEVLLFRLGDAELVPGVLDVRRQVLPGLGLFLGRLDVVVDVLEVDLVEVAAPLWERAREEVVQ